MIGDSSPACLVRIVISDQAFGVSFGDSSDMRLRVLHEGH